MSDSPNIKTFDLAQVLMGRSFPEIEAVFYLDEAAALKLTRLEARITRLELMQKHDEAKVLADQVETLREQIRDSKHVAHLRGISNKARQDLLKKATEKHPKERDFLGNVLDNDDRDELFTVLLWQAMLVKVVGPEGAQQEGFTLEQVETLRGMLPMAATLAISAAVNELSSGSKSGFEDAAQDGDFLSQP